MCRALNFSHFNNSERFITPVFFSSGRQLSSSQWATVSLSVDLNLGASAFWDVPTGLDLQARASLRYYISNFLHRICTVLLYFLLPLPPSFLYMGVTCTIVDKLLSVGGPQTTKTVISNSPSVMFQILDLSAPLVAANCTSTKKPSHLRPR